MRTAALPRRAISVGSAALAVLVALLVLRQLLRPALAVTGGAADAAVRVLGRQAAATRLRAWPRLQVAAATVYYTPGARTDAAVVAAAVRADYPRVLADYGLPADTPAAVAVVTAGEMARYVGGASTDPALGAYADGVVWLLEPSAFLTAGPALAARYAAVGPVPHELTHLADDIVSAGRTPAWLDEGLAQYEEWRLNGYVWAPAGSDFGGRVYSWTELTTEFGDLPNTGLAYRQALAATAAICRTGAGVCVGILRELRAGMPVDAALGGAIGARDLAALEGGAAWRPGIAARSGAPAGPRP